MSNFTYGWGVKQKYDKCELCNEKFIAPSKFKYCWTCFKKTPVQQIESMYKKEESDNKLRETFRD